MKKEEMNFERCQALEEIRNLRKQNAILVKALKDISDDCRFQMEDNISMNISFESEVDGSFAYANGGFLSIIKTINKALREKAIKK